VTEREKGNRISTIVGWQQSGVKIEIIPTKFMLRTSTSKGI